MRIDIDCVLLKKLMLTHIFPCAHPGRARDIIFATSICLAYFLREKLELPPPAKPLAMVFVLDRRVL